MEHLSNKNLTKTHESRFTECTSEFFYPKECTPILFSFLVQRNLNCNIQLSSVKGENNYKPMPSPEIWNSSVHGLLQQYRSKDVIFVLGVNDKTWQCASCRHDLCGNKSACPVLDPISFRSAKDLIQDTAKFITWNFCKNNLRKDCKH